MTKENEHKSNQSWSGVWKGIALVAGIFSFILCVLIIANFFQINRSDPVNTELMNALVERLNQDPSDDQLREEIRALDLVARKAYFTNQWQIRIGGYLLLMGIVVIVIAMQILISDEKKKVLLNPQKANDLLLTQMQSRKWIAAFSAALVVITIVFAFLSHQQLGSKFQQAAVANTEQSDPVPGDQQEIVSDLPRETPNSEVTEEVSQPETIADKKVSDEIKKVAEPLVSREEKVIEPKEIQSEKTETAKETPTDDGDVIPNSNEVIDKFTVFRGPGGNGITSQKNVPTHWNGETGENILWKVPIPLSGFNSPIIWGEKIFLTGASASKQEVYCIDGNTGEFLWTTELKNVPGSPADPPKVEGYTGYAAPTMATDGNNVFAIFASGDVGAFSMEGKPVWSRNLGNPDNHYGYSSSLITFANKVIIQWDQRDVQKVIALNVKTGEIEWDTPRDVKISWASPVLVTTQRGPELILAADPFVISYNPENGEEWWRIKCLSGEVGPSVAYANGIVFAMNEYASLVGIDITGEPKKLWEQYDFLSDVPSPVATDEYLFIPVSWAMVACYESKTGELLWEHEYDNSIYASPIITEDKVYLMDKKGVMHIFKVAGEYISVAEPPLGEGSVCTPAFADGRIYIRGEQNLYCIGGLGK